MNRFRADLHCHTLLSPCGDIEMTPARIVRTALERGWDIIGITDHNTTVQGREIKRMVGDGEPYILCGAEVTTREEVHCLVFADNGDSLDALQKFLDDSLPRIPNDEEVFGYQLAVNEAEEVIYEAPYLLISAIDRSIEEVAAFAVGIHPSRPAVRRPGNFGPVQSGRTAGAAPLAQEAEPVVCTFL